MTKMRGAVELAALLLAAPAAASAAEPFPPARPVVPFVADGDVGCSWMMHDRAEKWIRGSIGQGDEDPVISLVDHAFDRWGDRDDYPIEVSVGDRARRVTATAWAGTGDGDRPGSLGFYLDARLRKLIGGATSLQVWRDGKPVFNAALAATPSAAELDACVRPPSEDHGDSE